MASSSSPDMQDDDNNFENNTAIDGKRTLEVDLLSIPLQQLSFHNPNIDIAINSVEKSNTDVVGTTISKSTGEKVIVASVIYVGENCEDERPMPTEFVVPGDDVPFEEADNIYKIICMAHCKQSCELREQVKWIKTWKQFLSYLILCEHKWQTKNVGARNLQPPEVENTKHALVPVGVTTNYAILRQEFTDIFWICKTSETDFENLKWIQIEGLTAENDGYICWAGAGKNDTFIIATQGMVPTFQVYALSLIEEESTIDCKRLMKRIFHDSENFPSEFKVDSNRNFFAYVNPYHIKGLTVIKMSTLKSVIFDAGKHEVSTLSFGESNEGNRFSWYREKSQETVRFKDMAMYKTPAHKQVEYCHWVTERLEAQLETKNSGYPYREDAVFIVDSCMTSFFQFSKHNISGFIHGIYPFELDPSQCPPPNVRVPPPILNRHFQTTGYVFDASIVGDILFVLREDTGAIWMHQLSSRVDLTDIISLNSYDRSLNVGRIQSAHYRAISACVDRVSVLYPSGVLSFFQPIFTKTI